MCSGTEDLLELVYKKYVPRRVGFMNLINEYLCIGCLFLKLEKPSYLQHQYKIFSFQCMFKVLLREKSVYSHLYPLHLTTAIHEA